MPNKMKRPRQRKPAQKQRPPAPSRGVGLAKLVVPYKVRQHFPTVIQTAQTVPVGFFGSLYAYGTFQFRLSDITNFTKFTVLYDQYMIKSISMHFLPTQRDSIIQFTDVLGGAAALTETMFSGPTYLHMVPDYDDFVSPTTANEVISRPNSQTLDLVSPKSIGIAPKATYKTSDIVGNTSTVVPKGTTWIDCSASNIDHCGFKYAWQIPVFNQSNYTWPYERHLSCIVTYELAFRYPRL